MSTIAAISTAPGNAGIGIIRISGKQTFKIIKKIFKTTQENKIKRNEIRYGHIIDENKEVIDEVLVSYFFAPKSYTGEDVCEINAHGNNNVLKKILDVCILNGARLAEPGEFTKRAFLNGRIDLLQAESVMELINSKSELERKTAVKNLEGELSQKIKKIKSEILSILSNIEVSVDYPEYDIEEISTNNIKNEIKKIIKNIESLEKTFENGKLLRDGINIAIVGRPNAGKSSLLNKILKEERAIVTEIEGTTRDTIEEFINIEGIPFKIIDTAGIRQADNEIEKIGINKTKKAIKEADIVIAIFDISKELQQEDFDILEMIQEKKAIILLNKVDLKDKKINKACFEKYSNKKVLEISIKEEQGIEQIFKELKEMFNIEEINTENTAIITNIRQKEALSKAKKSLEKVLEEIKKEIPTDIISIFLREALENIDKITGENVTEELLEDIFSKFCLGK